MAADKVYPTTDLSRERLLMEASAHLRAAITTLQAANENDLRDKVFHLANDVLHARRDAR